VPALPVSQNDTITGMHTGMYVLLVFNITSGIQSFNDRGAHFHHSTTDIRITFIQNTLFV